MGCIYCITNLINNKKYIGKTKKSIQERFKEHYRDSKKYKCKNRPLYVAINQYGIDNFQIELIEYVENNLLSEREKYWIHKLNTCNKGYNISKGGDGTTLYDYNKIISLYTEGYTQKYISDKLQCCEETVSHVLKKFNIDIRYGSTKKVDQYDLYGNYIQSFYSAADAVNYLIENNIVKSKQARSHITSCCKNKLKTAYGYIWKYANL